MSAERGLEPADKGCLLWILIVLAFSAILEISSDIRDAYVGAACIKAGKTWSNGGCR
jgi:hypothetical protein